jgi:hypothetical protein
LLSGTAGTGISVSTSSGNLTITNTGLLSGTAGTGISVSTSSGNLTITNSGVTSNVAGTGISISGATGAVTITNSGVTSITAGSGISISGATGGVTITNTITNNNQLTNGAGYITGITSGNVTTALGYTPYNSSNPSGYITGINSSMVTTALGYTPVQPNGTGASGTWSINVTGTAASETLATVTGRGGSTTSQVSINREASINTTTPGTAASYGLHFGGQTTADLATGLTFSAGNATSTNANAGIYIQGSGAYGTRMYIATTDSYATGAKTAITINEGGTVTINRSFLQSNTDLRAPIFYDSNNTGFYVDPSSTSNLSRADILNTYVGNAIYFGGGNNYFNWDGSKINSNVSIQSTSDMRAPIFYDSDNTGYYLNPAGTSNINAINIAGGSTIFGGYGSGSGPGVGLENQGSFMRWAFWGMDFYDWNNGSLLTLDNGYALAPTNMRSPIFYDSDNTGYYLDPAGSSVLNGTVVIKGNDNQLAIDGTAGGLASGLFFRESGNNKWELYNYSGEFRFYNYTTSQQEMSLNNSGGYITARTSFRAPIFYDSNDTGYYCDPASDSRLNTTTTNQNYTYGWFRNYSNNTGLYNQDTTMHWSSTSNGYWDVSSTTSVSSIRFYTGGHLSALRGYVYANTSNEIGFLNSGGNWGLRMDNSYNVQVYGQLTVGSGTSSDIYMTDTDENTRRIHTNSSRIGFLSTSNTWGSYCGTDGSWFSDQSMRAPIFYDSADTGYYIDPASTSRMNNIMLGSAYTPVYTGQLVLGSTSYNFNFLNGSWSSSVTAGILANCADEWEFVIHDSGTSVESVFIYQNSTGRILMGRDIGWGTTPIQAAADFRAPIFYDSNDTGYYLDPSSISNTNSMRAGEFRGNANVGGTGEATWHPAGAYVGGTMWQYGAMYKNNTDIYDINIGYANSSFRAPIFYDSNNTGYYLDPASGSYLYSLILSGNVYFRPSTWIQMDGVYGMYWPNNYGLHIYPNNDGSYGALQINGTKSGWSGIHFNDSGDHLMANNNEVGHYQRSVGWKFRWYQGTMYVSRGTTGGGTEYTVVDTGNISSYTSGNTNSISSAVGGSYTWTNVNYFRTNQGGYCGSLDSGRMQAYSDSNNSAFFSFHKGGHYAVNMGLDADNVIRIGGWSASANRWQLDMSGNNWAANSFRSTYFYDQNDTGYYGAFSGTSRMNRINIDYLYSYNWVYAQGDVIAYYSDERLKTKTGNIENALDKIKQLNGFYYTNNELAKSFGYKEEKTQVGLSAQEVQSVLPEVVTIAPFDTEFDENQNPIGSKSGENYLTVNYDKLVPLLIEAIKEQQSQIEELKSKLDGLTK